VLLDLSRVDTDSNYRNEARHLCYTDHFFLADVLGKGFNGFKRRVHQPMADLYFPKNPGLTIPEQHKIKNRLHLDPRTTGKTTMGRVDIVQWVLAFPEDISILTETATKPLAEAISRSIAEMFWNPKDMTLTPLQRLFPELVVTGKQPTGIWDAPVRLLGTLDNTLNFTSPKSTQSGWHPWVTNVDDICDTENSGIHAADAVRQGVIDTYYTNKNTLLPGGYNFVKGTRYHPFELYGDILDKMDPDQWRILVRSAMKIKSGRKLLPGEFPEEDDIELIFPEMPGMDYRSLREKFFDNYEAFMAQQQNDPQGGHIATFDEELYQTLLIAPERIPPMGEMYICWRLPYGGKEYMNGIAEGAAARVWEGKVNVLDAWSGKYTPSRLAEKIVKECREHQCEYLMMEALPGTEYMEGSLRNELARRNVSCRIQWFDFEDDDNLRGERIKTLEPQMRQGRVKISTACGKQGELKRQLVNFGLVRENGIVDAISRLAAKVPVSIMRQEIEEEEIEAQRRLKDSMAYHFVHGFGIGEGVSAAEKRQKEQAFAAQVALERTLSIGMTDILGGLDG
jgi:hypothetical protein